MMKHLAISSSISQFGSLPLHDLYPSAPLIAFIITQLTDPEPPDDTTTIQELGTKQLTVIVWPQSRNGHNPSHLREAILNPLLGIGQSGGCGGSYTKSV